MKALRILIGLFLAVMCFDSLLYAQDWPGLGRYQEANKELGAPVPGEKRVVFMGNSITEGWGKKYPEFFEGKPYVNRGISGQTTPQMLIRFRQDVIDLAPALVLIMAGTNDIAGNTGPSTLEMIEDNIISMAELAKANGIKVILCSVLPALDFGWKKGLEPADKIIALNTLIKRYADKNGIPYLDYYSSLVDKQKGLDVKYSTDGVHPTRAGYEVMSPLADEAIKKALTGG